MIQSQAVRSLTIAGLARAGNVGVETVRFYQRRRLLDEPERGQRGVAAQIRRYGDEHVRRLKFIRAAQAAGFLLEEIRVLLDLNGTTDRSRVRALAAERLSLIDNKITNLQAVRKSLRQLVDACMHTTSGPCPILESFEH